jgi:hypothetical protein
MNTEPRRHRIPLWLKIAYTAFMAVLIPFYWYSYGPTNFLYFCDVAILVTLVAIWIESRFLIGMQAVAIIVPQMLWVGEFAVKALTGRSIIHITDYMFDPKNPAFVRCLSSFHGWLPFLLIYLVWRIGYDRRALVAQTIACWVLLLACYFFTPPPPNTTGDRRVQVNINYVYGIGEERPQGWMAPWLWMALLMTGLPLGVYLPTHLILDRLFGRRRREADGVPAAAALTSGRG